MQFDFFESKRIVAYLQLSIGFTESCRLISTSLHQYS
nr:MAG TPA: hypothetical protein [Bacteriophage sp.]DAK54912.1 MAG TPA: hypothetical protein [Caudoviricetes sp.]DAN08092.1 MAG TPA: hypothetical protein [Caudoviricetes sp.]DAQ54913.1 MAG TPA: hypothetical protein [Caudoviricetes sp.]DAV93224.1 MAG TPA: hypothetical protein [Caudoviricetes sp.]